MADSPDHLAASDIFETGHPRVRHLVDPLLEAAAGEVDLARRIFERARDAVAYSPYVPFSDRVHYRASTTLERGRGYCVQKAVLLVTMARAAGIPGRLVFVDMRNHQAPPHLVRLLGTNLFTWHCYARLLIRSRWLDATPAFDRAICEEHQLPLLRFDGQSSAIFPARDDLGRPYAEYTAHHGVFDDVPLGPMLSAWNRAYGAEKVNRWRRSFLTGARTE